MEIPGALHPLFAAPPLGLISWLSLDSKKPALARRAGRAGVRGALLLSIIGGAVFMNYQVSLALRAINYAQLKPVDEARVEKIILEKKRLRQQKRQKQL